MRREMLFAVPRGPGQWKRVVVLRQTVYLA
jgi:hypothetical protein